MTITVDVRERRSDVPVSLAALGVEVLAVTLAVGDYAVGDRVVERKTVADLHRSLADRRMWSRVGSLRCDPRRAYLMVEGADLDDGPVPPRAIRGALLEAYDNGIRVLRTASPEDSALWPHVLAHEEHHRLERRASALVGGRPIFVAPVGLLSSIPGIGIPSAKALLARFGSVSIIAATSKRELQSIPSVGLERASAVIRALTQAETHAAASRRPIQRFSASAEKLVPGRALRRRNELPRRYLRRRLGRGGTAAPERESLALLPSGSDAVRTLSVRGTLPVNASCVDPIPMKPSLGRRSVPLERISGSGNRCLPT